MPAGCENLRSPRAILYRAAISTKDLVPAGNTRWEIRLRPLVAALLIVPALAARARADACATLSGEPDLVATVTEALRARGIAPEATCSVHARVEKSGDAVVVHIEADHAPVERTVSSADSAATMIESWARADVAAPLLVARAPAPAGEDEPAPRAEARVVVSRPRGIHLFTDAESSVASDGTVWAGAQVGACIELGPLCAAARARFANVLIGPDPFDGELDRRSIEVLIGGDVPLTYRGVRLMPGIAGGVGSMHTHVDSMGTHMGRETGGMRAEAHVTGALPITPRLAFELSLSIDITQQTESEQSGTIMIPNDPLLFARVGAGLRYEGL